MMPRPKNTDTMDDVLKMQNDYLTQQKEENFRPAAEAITTSKGELRKTEFLSKDSGSE